MDQSAVKQQEVKIPKRILDALLLSLSAGVVPRSGAPYIAIGRNEEIAALLDNLETVENGGAAVRFLIGRYGSGKSFLMQLIRGRALEKDFVTADADLSPERKLCGGNGVATYRELMRNMACKASPESGAMHTVLSRFYLQMKQSLVKDGILPENNSYNFTLKQRLFSALSSLQSNVGGFDFVTVLGLYYEACMIENEEQKSAALRWLRGEYMTKTEAKNGLGFPVSTIIGDDNWYDYVKLWADFSAIAGYKGLIVFLDECVNLFKISNRISREANYEKLLAIFNDTMQGRATNLGVIFSGTPQFLEDTRRGLFSYEALKSRLADSRYQEMGFRNMSSPVIRLRTLSANEILALLARLTKLWQQKYPSSPVPNAEQMQAFLMDALQRAGAEELMTPREMIRNYLSLLAVLRDNPDATFEASIGTQSAETNEGTAEDDIEGFSDFQLF